MERTVPFRIFSQKDNAQYMTGDNVLFLNRIIRM